MGFDKEHIKLYLITGETNINHFYKLLSVICFLLLIDSANAQTQAIKWWFDTKDASFGQSAAADIDHDGKLEIVFGCYRNDSCIYALNAEDGSLLWKFNARGVAEGCNDVAPLIYDVDNDDSLEVIVASSCNPVTYCFNGKSGKIKWQVNTRGSDSPPTIADIDNDGKPEILHGEFDGYVLCINAEDGSIAWEIAVDTKSWIQTAPTILDLNGDGQLDFVVSTWNNVKIADNKVYAYSGDTHSLLWTYPIGNFIYHGSAVADLDHDQKPELVIGSYNDTLYCINGEDGTTNWKFSLGEYFYMGAPATIADLDNDGWCEVVFSTWYKIGALTHDGKPLWQYDIPNYEQAFRGVAIADISGDDSPDVIFGTDGGNITALNGKDGTHLWTKNLREHHGDSLFKLDNAPLVADFNNDDTLEVFIVGGHGEYPEFKKDFGRAYMISAGKGSGPDWLMFQHDARRQSSLCEFIPVSVNEEVTKEKYETKIFPNPANNKLTIQFSNPGNEKHTLMIYNALGQIVQAIETIRGEETIETSSLPGGIYMLLIKANDKFEVRNFVLGH